MSTNFKEFWEGIKYGQEQSAKNISIVFNSIFMSIAYFIGIGVISIFGKIFGKHFIELVVDKNSSNYWNELNLSVKPAEEYLRQF